MLPKVRISTAQKETYERAVEKCRRRNPSLTVSQWIRFACDQQATIDLASRVPKGSEA